MIFLSPAHQPQAFLIYAKGRPGMIKGLNLDRNDVSEVMIPITSLTRPTTLDYDVRTQFIYYADIQRWVETLHLLSGSVYCLCQQEMSVAHASICQHCRIGSSYCIDHKAFHCSKLTMCTCIERVVDEGHNQGRPAVRDAPRKVCQTSGSSLSIFHPLHLPLTCKLCAYPPSRPWTSSMVFLFVFFPHSFTFSTLILIYPAPLLCTHMQTILIFASLTLPPGLLTWAVPLVKWFPNWGGMRWIQGGHMAICEIWLFCMQKYIMNCTLI